MESYDFFNAVVFPEMSFESKIFKRKSGNNFKLSGKLTIRDITKSVTFDAILKVLKRYLALIKLLFMQKLQLTGSIINLCGIRKLMTGH